MTNELVSSRFAEVLLYTRDIQSLRKNTWILFSARDLVHGWQAYDVAENCGRNRQHPQKHVTEHREQTERRAQTSSCVRRVGEMATHIERTLQRVEQLVRNFLVLQRTVKNQNTRSIASRRMEESLLRNRHRTRTKNTAASQKTNFLDTGIRRGS